MKKLIAVALLVTLAGCGWFDRKITANFTGYSNVCIKGFNVIQMASGAFYEEDAHGNKVPCR